MTPPPIDPLGYPAPPAYTEQEFDRKVSRAEEISLQAPPPAPRPPPDSGSDLTEEQWAEIEEAAFQAAIAASLAEAGASGNEMPRQGATPQPGPPSPRRRSPQSVQPLRIEKKSKGSVDLKDSKERPKWLSEAQASSSFQAGSSSQGAATHTFDGDEIPPPPFAESAPSYPHSHREVAVIGFESSSHAPSSESSSPALSPLPDLDALSISASVSEQEHSTRRNALPQPPTHHMERHPVPNPQHLEYQQFDSHPQYAQYAQPTHPAPTLSAPPGALTYQSDQRPRHEIKPPSSPSPSNFNSYWSTPSTPSRPSIGAPLVQFNPSVAYGKSPFQRLQQSTPPPIPVIDEPRQEVYRANAFYNSSVSAHLPLTPQRPATHDRRQGNLPAISGVSIEARLDAAVKLGGAPHLQVKMRMLEQEEETDDGIEVTWEDQQRINTFSKLNARHGIIEGKLKDLKDEKEALDDLGMDLELADEDEDVLYKIGETFVHMRPGRARTRLRRDQKQLDKKLEDLSTQAGDCQTQMKELKTLLYGKFGKSINLDE